MKTIEKDSKGKIRVKKCPFCGAKAKIWYENYADCSSSGCFLYSLEFPPTIEKWNNRRGENNGN